MMDTMSTGTASPAVSEQTSDGTRVLLVTGLSGAGKSSALKVLEDLGYDAVDNLPLSLLPRVIEPDADARPLAIGIDTRTRGFDPAGLVTLLSQIRQARERQIALVYLDCAGEELARRFSETRRRHPMAQDRPVTDGIARERELMAPLRQTADHVIDTTAFSIHQLRQLLGDTFGLARSAQMTVSIMSFGFARGMPRDADLVFDMRFLRNPHWDQDLRPLTGLDDPVAAYVEADDSFAPAFERMRDLTLSLLPLYKRGGKSYLVIAFGCTGGQHRSVVTAERMAEAYRDRGLEINVIHRDITAREPSPGESAGA